MAIELNPCDRQTTFAKFLSVDNGKSDKVGDLFDELASMMYYGAHFRTYARNNQDAYDALKKLVEVMRENPIVGCK